MYHSTQVTTYYRKECVKKFFERMNCVNGERISNERANIFQISHKTCQSKQNTLYSMLCIVYVDHLYGCLEVLNTIISRYRGTGFQDCDIFSTMCDGPLGQCACLSLISLTQSRFFAFVARPLNLLDSKITIAFFKLF